MDNRDYKESPGGINNKVLEWARQQSTYLESEVADILQVSENEIIEWERGSKLPNISTLRHLSSIYDIPFSYFFSHRLPRQIPVEDYRGKPRKPSRETQLAIREFRRLHRFSRILRNLTKEETKQGLDFLSGREDIEEIASRERERLGITTVNKNTWVDKKHAWHKCRSSIEGLGIAVFSLRMPPLECHGAAIGERPCSILVNRNEAPAAKCFTLFHEYYHLLLKSGDNLFLCDSFPSDTESKPNQFASLVLASNQEFLDGLRESHMREYREFWSDSTLNDLSNKFLVSRDVVAIRLEQLGYAPEGFYAKRRSHWESLYKGYRGSGLGGMTKMGHAREKIGDSTLSITLQAVKLGFISAVDAASYFRDVRESRGGIPWNVTVSDIGKWIRET
jgi:Zn-dependent peptidase ImmA (M78 family)/DNA-binding XRE family transcriptional regulator